MSQISASGAAGALSSSGGVTNRFQEMSSEDFIEIMFTELSNQDPFEPNDSAALLEQLNSIRSIEADIKLTNQLETIVLENQLASAGNMIGKYVEGLSDSAQAVGGTVVSAVRQDDQIRLGLDNGWEIAIESVTLITDLEDDTE